MAKITHDVCHHERPGEAKWLSRSMASMAAPMCVPCVCCSPRRARSTTKCPCMCSRVSRASRINVDDHHSDTADNAACHPRRRKCLAEELDRPGLHLMAGQEA